MMVPLVLVGSLPHPSQPVIYKVKKLPVLVGPLSAVHPPFDI